jgi:hypothetical protein
MIGQFPPHLCPKPAQTGILQGSFTTSDLLSILEAELGITHNSFGGYKELKYLWKNSQENLMCKN